MTHRFSCWFTAHKTHGVIDEQLLLGRLVNIGAFHEYVDGAVAAVAVWGISAFETTYQLPNYPDADER